MDVDDTYSKVVGTFGRCQFAIYLLLSVYSFTTPTLALFVVFISSTPAQLKEYNSKADNDSSIIAEWDLYDSKWISDLIQSLFFLGFLFGVLIFGQASDKFGRRITLIVGFHLQPPIALITSFAWSWKVFAACRCLTGFFTGGVGLVSFIYMQEIVGRSWWAITGSYQNNSFSIGIVVMSGISYLIPSWRILLRVLAFIMSVPLLFLWLIPESPRWLYSNAKLQKAEEALVFIAKKNGVQAPNISLVKRSEPTKLNKTYTIYDLIKNKITLKRVLIMGFLWFVASLVYYALTMAAGDLAKNVYLSEAFSGLVEIPSTVINAILLNRTWCGRKGSSFSGFLISGLCCFGLMGYSSNSESTFKLVLGLGGKFAINFAFNTLYVYTPELFPTCIRNLSMGTLSMVARIGGILASFAKSFIESNGIVGYLLFAMCGLGAAFLSLLLPETLGSKPPDSFEDLMSNVKKRGIQLKKYIKVSDENEDTEFLIERNEVQ